MFLALFEVMTGTLHVGLESIEQLQPPRLAKESRGHVK